MKRRYLFILCPPFSGSTLLYRVLSTSPHCSSFFGSSDWVGEGQFIPAVREIMRSDPWNPDFPMPWDTIQTEWDRHWDPSKAIFLEKSPPNLCRADQIEAHFSKSGSVSFIGMIRNPYATRQAPETWLRQARFQQRNRAKLKNLLFFTYEELCASTESLCDAMLRFLPELGSLSPGSNVDTGDEERSGPIQNKNTITRSLARSRTRALREHADLLQSFGYSVYSDSQLEEAGSFLPEYSITRDIDVSANQLWSTIRENPERLLLGFHGRCQVDLRAGGHWQLDASRETGVRASGKVIELTPEAGRLRLSWQRSSDSPTPGSGSPDPSEVTFSWRPLASNRIEVRILHESVHSNLWKELSPQWKRTIDALATAFR